MASQRVGGRLARPRGGLSPRVTNAIERVTELEPAYTRAVRRVLSGGGQLTQDLLVQPVDTARDKANALLAARDRGEATDRDVIEAHNALARLMEMVIGNE